jgi:hypothetical protein
MTTDHDPTTDNDASDKRARRRAAGRADRTARVGEERVGAFGDEVGALVGDEVSAAGDELDREVVGVRPAAAKQARGDVQIAPAEDDPGWDVQPLAAVAAGHGGQELVPREVAIQSDGCVSARRVAQPLGEQLDVDLRKGGWVNDAVAQDPAYPAGPLPQQP